MNVQTCDVNGQQKIKVDPMLGPAEANAVSYPHFAETLGKSLDDFDYGFQTTINKREVNGLLDFGLIRHLP